MRIPATILVGLLARAVAAEEPMRLASPAFEHGQAIPRRHTCDGAGTPVPLRWSQVPPGTRSLALLAEDPDAPAGSLVHWVLYDLPAASRALPGPDRPRAGRAGRNDFRTLGYAPPCPPAGRAHHYYFRLYALDALVGDATGATAAKVRRAMAGHVLAVAEVMGIYARQ